MDSPQTRQSRWTNLGGWCWLFLTWLAFAGIAGRRHPEFGLAFGFAGCLVFAIRLVFGPETGRVFLVGFAAGVCIEWGAYFSVMERIASGKLDPQAFNYFYPFTFQYFDCLRSLG